jgi:hypothetical protein
MPLGRRAFSVLAALAPLQRLRAEEPSFSEAARRRLLIGPGWQSAEPERARLLEQALQHLAAGEADAALDAAERATSMRHAADSELLIVRAFMAGGQYRRALAACAHTAGAHREQNAGTALYAWLLHCGGQEVVARRLLSDALQRSPADPVLQHTSEQVQTPWPRAGAPLRQAAWQAAPLPHAESTATQVSARAGVVGTAVLLAGGSEAVLPTSLLHHGGMIWVRNGLGRTSLAQRVDLDDPDLSLLRLVDAMPPPTWALAPREPFAGSPGCVVEYAEDALGQAAWPLLRQGFFAGVPGTQQPSRPLGLDVPAGPRGGPVFDAAGRLAGLAYTTASGENRLTGLQRLARHLGTRLPPAAEAAPAPRVGPENAYELALLGALQVISDPGRRDR